MSSNTPDPIEAARNARHAENQAKAAQVLADQDARQANARAKAAAAEAKLAGLGFVPEPIASVASTPAVAPVVRYVPPAALTESPTREEALAMGVRPWSTREERMRAVADPMYKSALHGADYRRAIYARDAVTPDGIA